MRMTLSKRRMLAAAASAALVFGLAACSSDDNESDDATDTTESESEDQTDEGEDDAEEPNGDADDPAEGEEEEDNADDTAASGDGDTPQWAEAVTSPGESIATLEGTNFEVEVYQVGVAPSPEDGLLVDPDNNQPVLAEGDDVVFVNYVVTNTSDEAIPMSSSLVSMEATYEDWPYLQGMDTINDAGLHGEMEVNGDSIADRQDDGIYPLGPGQSISYGQSFMYRTDAALVLEATLTPVDENSDLVDDERQEVTAEVTLS